MGRFYAQQLSGDVVVTHHGKVVMVTGAARGIGRAVAELFAVRGADVVACDVAAPVSEAQSGTAALEDLEQTARLVRDHGRSCLTSVTDVREQDSLDAAVSAALAQFGHIDVLVANAGIMHSQRFWEIGEATWQTVIDINLSGVWRSAKAVAPHMMDRKTGVIIATASVQGHVARKGLTAYTSSKHGLLGLTKSLALELGDHNIRVNAVLPGATHTPMVDNDAAGRVSGEPDASEDNARTDYFRGMSALRDRSVLPPEAVAESISWLASDHAMHVTGVELPVDAGSMVLPGINLGAIKGRRRPR